MNIDKWLKSLQWIPPYPKVLTKVTEFNDISRGRIVRVTIEEKPQDLSKLMEWAEYRKSIGKPLIIARTYLKENCIHQVLQGKDNATLRFVLQRLQAQI